MNFQKNESTTTVKVEPYWQASARKRSATAQRKMNRTAKAIMDYMTKHPNKVITSFKIMEVIRKDAWKNDWYRLLYSRPGNVLKSLCVSTSFDLDKYDGRLHRMGRSTWKFVPKVKVAELAHPSNGQFVTQKLNDVINKCDMLRRDAVILKEVIEKFQKDSPTS